MYHKNWDNMWLRMHFIMGKARRVYFMAIPENEEELKRSRGYYICSDTVVQTVAQLTSGTFLVALLAYVGISDAAIGVLISLGCFFALFQLLSLNYVTKLKKYKLFVCFTSLQRLFFVAMYFVPVLPISTTWKILLIISFYSIGQLFAQISIPTTQDWIASILPSQIRGSYLAIKDSVAVGVVALVMLIAGMLLDYFKQHDLVTGFCIIGSSIFVMVIISFVCLSLMKEPRYSVKNEIGKEVHGRRAKRIMQDTPTQEQIKLSEVVKEAFASEGFRKATTLNLLWMCSFYIALPFNASYQVKELGLPYTFIMIVGFVTNIVRVCLTPKIGKLADRHGMSKVLQYVLFSLGISNIVMMFTVPSNGYGMTILCSFFAALGWTFIGSGLFGVQLEFLDEEKRVVQLSILSALSGVFGFMVSLVAGRLLDYLQQSPIVLLGTPLYAQQVLNLLGFMMILVTIGYIKLVIQAGPCGMKYAATMVHKKSC